MSTSTLKVLVTGGTSGLGLAMAAALASAGARVALTGRSAERAAAVAATLRADRRRRIRPLAARPGRSAVKPAR